MDSVDLGLLRSYVVDGDADAFGELVDQHSGWITAAARRRLRDEHLAQDAAQVVFVLLESKSAELVDSQHASIAAWLFHAMNLTCSRLRRSRDRRQRREATLPVEPSRKLPCDEVRAMLEDAIAQLPSLDRQAIVKRYYQGQNYQSIGEELDCSAEAVRKRIARSLANVREWMLHDGIDAIPDELLSGVSESTESHTQVARLAKENRRIKTIAKGASTMMQQTQDTDFSIWSAEFFVKDVEANLDFFEKLGFRRHFIDTPDAMGRIPRASLRGGKTARIWLRRATESEGNQPAPGVTLFFWIDGGADALMAHRDTIAAQGVKPSAFFDDVSLRNFTVTSPDGYSIGFFTAYK
jgi:RNA polymerase sigma factor (sigma-70 family)